MAKSPFRNHGFSLIEVVVATALMALVITMLVKGQIEYMALAEEANELIVSSELGRKKLLDCKYQMLKEGFSATGFSAHGDFSDEGYPDTTWECVAPPFDIPPPNMELISQVTKGTDSENKNLMTQIMGVVYPMVVPAISNSARELVTIVRWKIGTTTPQEFKITTHVINQVQFAQTMMAFPNLGQLMQGALQGGSKP